MAISTLRQHDKLNRLARRQHWLGPFLKFIDSIRIDSREVPAEDERGSKLHLWTTQRLFLEQLAEGLDRGQHTFLTLKGRQQGLSTITLAVLLFWVAVHPRSIAALVCNEEKVRDAFRDLLKRYHESFPPEFFGDAFAKVRHNSAHFLFSNGSRIDYLIAGSRKVNWGESRGYSVCLCTEVASYGQEDGINNFIEALAQENPDRLFMWESTAKGPNHWQEMWNDAEKDEENVCRIFLGWWAKDLNRIRKNQPHYPKYAGALNGEETELCNEVLERYGHVITMEQLAWWRWKLATSDRQAAEQNQPWTPEQAFVLSGYSFFATRLLQEQYERVYHKPFEAYHVHIGSSFWTLKLEKVAASADAELKIWENPIQGAQYVIGCDPAYGHSDDSDSHCISVWRCYADRLVQVAEYADNRPETKHCAWVLAGLAGAYRNSIVNLELYGPGRVVMNEFDSVRIQLRAEMFNQQREDNDWDEDFMAGARWFMYRRQDSPGPGFVYNFECLALDTLLPTPTGWTTMGEVAEGDWLLSDTGRPTQIVAVSATKHNYKCYEIVFDDGTKIVADETHRWKVARLHWKNKSDKIRTTAQLRPGKFYIRQAEAIDLPERDLPLDPYLLGVWLGDGTSAAATVSSGDLDVEEMCALIEACGQPTRRVRRETCWTISLTDDVGNRGEFIRALRQLGVLNNKHIPEIYLRASHAQRLALLQGLMDTDGSASGNGGGQCEFVTTLPALVKGFSELVRSLGFKAKFLTFDESKYKGVECALRYQFWFTAYPEMPVFRLSRKVAKLSARPRKFYRKPCHRIVSIKKVESVPVKCVMVDSPTSMFLAGEGMIPTHNTSAKRKFELFNMFRDAFTSNVLEINSARCIEEMNNMVQEKGDIAPAAPGRQHDDRPFAAALACYAWDSVVCGALRASMIAAGATYERVSAAERGENVGGQAIVDKLVYAYFARAEAEAEERELEGPWAHEDNPDPFLLSAAGWRARRGLA